MRELLSLKNIFQHQKLFAGQKQWYYFVQRKDLSYQFSCCHKYTPILQHGVRHYSKKVNWTKTEDNLCLNINQKNITIPWLWLRDHCRCEECYNHLTNQKNGVIDTSQPSSWSVTDILTLNGGQKIKLTWEDNHISEYRADWLIENGVEGNKTKKIKPYYWTGEKIKTQPLPIVQYSHHMGTTEGLTKSLENLLKYGFTIVQGTPVSIEDTQKVAERVTFIMETVFGRMWSFTSDLERADTAYSNHSLGAHTDTSYLSSPVGVQIFHCMEHDGEGGKTLLVDGVHAAYQLQQEREEDFNYLTQTEIAHEYIDKKHGDHLYSIGKVISLAPTTGQVNQIRFNRFDMAPLITIPAHETNQFYRSYNQLINRITDSHNEFWIKLEPGMVLFVDNWRVLHGRSSFTGKRVVCGCYLSQDDLASAQRRHNLL